MGCGQLFHILRRCKQLEDDDTSTQLKRCLGLIDLTALGVGSTLGLGVYVLAGAVAKDVAGPAVCISFLVAAIASALAGLCYAEFAARVPKAGSAYIFSYVSVGEFIAFTIGWNLILEYVIGTAGVAKGMALYIDSLFNNSMAKAMTEAAPINVSFMSTYPDFFAFALVVLITVLLTVGVNESTKINNMLVVLNLITVTIVIVAGIGKSNPANWSIAIEDVPREYKSDAGAGGFAPWGFAGIMTGAARCFFGFVGFDCVATTGEEAKNPRRDIPLSIAISLTTVFVAYICIAIVLTMMLPYYMQQAEAPFPHVFNVLNMPVIKWIVTIGAIFALCTSLLGAMFPLPRVLYAMSTDGMLFRSLASINKKTQTPMIATMLSGFFAAIMAAGFNLEQLIDLMSIGTLLSYTIVATSVLILRYEEESSIQSHPTKLAPETPFSVFKQLFNCVGLTYPTQLSFTIAKCTIFIFFLMSLATCTLLHWWALAAPAQCALGAALLVLLAVLARQPTQRVDNLSFKVPLVPLVPSVSVCMNMYLMVQLDYHTWMRFLLWMIIGQPPEI